MFTFLSVAFVLVLFVAAFYGFGIVMRKPPTVGDLSMETCSLCRERFDKTMLIERQVGDSRLFYFCPDCIHSLDKDLATLPPRNQDLS
jgi:hypothetical protein